MPCTRVPIRWRRPSRDHSSPSCSSRSRGEGERDAVAHGCTGKGNDQVRFDVATHALNPGLARHCADARRVGLTRDDEIDYAAGARDRDPGDGNSPRTRSTSTCGAARRNRRARRPVERRRPPMPTRGRSLRPRRPTDRPDAIDFEGGIPVALDDDPGYRASGRRDAGRPTQRARRRARRGPHRSRRGSPGRYQEPRGLRGTGRQRSCTPRIAR